MGLRFRKGDVIAIVAVVLLAVLVFTLFLPDGTDARARAEIYINGKLVRTVSLNTPQQFTLTGQYSNTITVSGSKIAITESDCPGKDCVRCGQVGSAGRLIVCLPNALEIRIVSGDGDVDFVVG